MKGQSNKKFAIGCLLTMFGGAGLAEISTSSHGLFWVCVITFSLGVGLCFAGYEK